MKKYYVRWNSMPVGELEKVPTMGWTLTYEDAWLLPLGYYNQDNRRAARMGGQRKEAVPHLIQDLIPEGENFNAICMRDNGYFGDQLEQVLTKNERFLSGFTCCIDQNRNPLSTPAVLYGRLNNFVQDGVFSGRTKDVPEFGAEDKEKIYAVIADVRATQLSGAQGKIPMHLDRSGVVVPALEKPFTHILKMPWIPLDDGSHAQAALEWLGLETARAGGVHTVDFAMAELSREKQIGLLVERFDIPTSDDDMRLIMAETLRSAMGKGDKYGATMEQAGAAIMQTSSDSRADGRQYFRLICASFFGENTDIHLQNVSLIEQVDPFAQQIVDVRLAPAYDIMNGAFLQGEPVSDRSPSFPMPITLNNKSENVELQDLLKLAKVLNIDVEEAKEIAYETAEGMNRRALEIHSSPPGLLARDEYADVLHHVRTACARICRFTHEFFPDLPAHAQKSMKAGPG